MSCAPRGAARLARCDALTYAAPGEHSDFVCDLIRGTRATEVLRLDHVHASRPQICDEHVDVA